MKFLFIHQNFPGQFKNLAPSLASRGHEVTALSLSSKNRINWNGVTVLPYRLKRSNTKGIHPWVIDFESKVIRGEACFDAAIELKKSGFYPDVIIGHPGWGECLFLKEVWPAAKLKLYFEYFYNTRGFDVGFDPEFEKSDIRDSGRVILKNANTLLHSQPADSILCPTEWQKSSFPEFIQERVEVIHEGIDTKLVNRRKDAVVRLASGKILTASDKVLTYVNRSLEPYRGIHVFLRSLKIILKSDLDIEVLIVGEEGIGYGSSPTSKMSWKQIFFSELSRDLTKQEIGRINFIGRVPYEEYLDFLSISTVHVYLTYPFVLSWSLLEAMSASCAIVASATPPVREVIHNDHNGKLVGFFDIPALAESVLSLIENMTSNEKLRIEARKTVLEHYDLETRCLPKQVNWACGVGIT